MSVPSSFTSGTLLTELKALFVIERLSLALNLSSYNVEPLRLSFIELPLLKRLSLI